MLEPKKHPILHLCRRIKALFLFILFVSISDYESLRIGGLVFAVALFLLGIALVVSKYPSAQHTWNVECERHYTMIRLHKLK